MATREVRELLVGMWLVVPENRQVVAVTLGEIARSDLGRRVMGREEVCAMLEAAGDTEWSSMEAAGALWAVG